MPKDITESNKIIIYKLRRKSDNQFSNGGSSPSWNHIGKSWNNLSAIKNHIHVVCRQLKYFIKIYTYNSCSKEQQQEAIEKLHNFLNDIEILKLEFIITPDSNNIVPFDIKDFI